MKLALQIILGLFSLIPLAFAVMGLMNGAAWLSPHAPVAAAVDNQFRYYSGMYLVVTLLLWSIIPEIQKHFRTLAIICIALFTGGVGRFISWRSGGLGAEFQLTGMFIELGAPLVLILAWLVARRAKG